MQIAERAIPPRENSRLKRSFDWTAAVTSEAFMPAVLIAVGLSALYWSLFRFTFGKWTETEGYYSHGFLVPFISGYIVYRWWPKLKQIPVKAGWLAAPFLMVCLWLAYAANRTDIYAILSLAFVLSLMLATWLIAGWRWMLAILAPIAYLLFALPVWEQAINNYTNPLQLASTKVAFHLLQLMALYPVQQDPTTIVLGNYQLQVAVACSGFKLILALLAFAVFFMLIAKLKVWANIVFAASIIPIALFINGLRIALVGVVGNAYGEGAGASFHDYSGYITIILCFILLDRWAKLLGYRKDAEAESGPAAHLSDAGRKALKMRAFTVGALLLLFGAVAFASSKPRPMPGRTEAWMERSAPSQIDDYKVASTYKMEKSTYDELQPYGIICRILSNGDKSFDVTLLASNRKASFHDPRVCFPAQGWQFDDQKRVNLRTDTRGVIPVTIISMIGDDHSPQLAAFFYRGPKGFYATPQALSLAMLIDQFIGRADDEGVFYRFMPGYPDATESELTAFIKEYMDQAPKTSGGFF